MRLGKPALLIVGALACVLIALALVKGVRLFWNPPPAPGGALIATAGANIGGPFRLIDATGKPFGDADLRGRYALIYFGYAFCPDVCPTELQAMGRAIDLLGPKGEAIVPVFITVDPARDTAWEIGPYVRAFHPRMIGLTGSETEIAAVAKAYRVYYRLGKPSAPGAKDYLVDHTSFLYLLGPDGKLAAMLRGGVGADAIAQGLSAVIR